LSKILCLEDITKLRMIRTVIISFVIFFTISFVGSQPMNQDSKTTLKVLVFSKSIGYRHESIPGALKMMKELADQNSWMIKMTEDSTWFTTDSLKQFDVIVFLLTGGDILDEKWKETFREFINAGGGLVTIHTGTYTMQEWPWFDNLIGASFIGHPPVQQGKLIIEDNTHPSASFLDEKEMLWTEEWYSYDRSPRSTAHVVMSVDENSYDVDDNRWFEGVQQRMGDHPVAWYHEREGGRVFQTTLGHNASAYQDEFMKKHIIGAILWAGHSEN
jgi:type 1 glutamine amidotransferase